MDNFNHHFGLFLIFYTFYYKDLIVSDRKEKGEKNKMR